LKTSYKPAQRATFPLRSNLGNNASVSWIVEPQLNWDKRWSRHHLHVLVATSFQDQTIDKQTTSARNFISEDQMDNPGAASSDDVTVTRNYADYRFASLFGRITYDWNQTYLLNLS